MQHVSPMNQDVEHMLLLPNRKHCVPQVKVGSSLVLVFALGKTTGNTINSTRDKLLKFKFGSVSLLNLFIMACYGPLFLIIGLLNKLLLITPVVPPAVSAFIGATLWFPQAINISSLGVHSLDCFEPWSCVI